MTLGLGAIFASVDCTACNITITASCIKANAVAAWTSSGDISIARDGDDTGVVVDAIRSTFLSSHRNGAAIDFYWTVGSGVDTGLRLGDSGRVANVDTAAIHREGCAVM